MRWSVLKGLYENFRTEKAHIWSEKFTRGTKYQIGDGRKKHLEQEEQFIEIGQWVESKLKRRENRIDRALLS